MVLLIDTSSFISCMIHWISTINGNFIICLIVFFSLVTHKIPRRIKATLRMFFYHLPTYFLVLYIVDKLVPNFPVLIIYNYVTYWYLFTNDSCFNMTPQMSVDSWSLLHSYITGHRLCVVLFVHVLCSKRTQGLCSQLTHLTSAVAKPRLGFFLVIVYDY